MNAKVRGASQNKRLTFSRTVTAHSPQGRSARECVDCGPAATSERRDRTAQGHRRFRCRDCGRQLNERSGGLLNRTQYPSDVIALVVLWRLRHRLMLQHLSEMFLQRGIVFSREAVREWEAKLTPIPTAELRQHGDLVDTMLSEHRDMAAAKVFFRSAKSATGLVPDRVTTDGHGSYPRAIRSTLGRGVRQQTSAYKNNRLEQDHRGVKGRTRCMRGFKAIGAAERFCRGYDELRALLRCRNRHNQHVPANCRRLLHLRPATTVLTVLQTA